jgi:formamidopyrimidine-DNA glycosylase
MPELPEVEITRRSIAPHLTGQTVVQVILRERRLRWLITPALEEMVSGQVIRRVERRAKYLLLRTVNGSVLLHLGMSGRLRILPREAPIQKHDHADIILASGYCLRFTDPRRFGVLLWTADPPECHPLLRDLGPEPLETDFCAAYLYNLARGREIPIKSYIMNSRVVVGIGNIYANEALFIAGIRPLRPAGRISLARYERLVTAIREVLTEAITQGGTTLRDFVGAAGEPGYFQQYLRVYGRARLPCPSCGAPIQLGRVGQRATYYCARCQR